MRLAQFLVSIPVLALSSGCIIVDDRQGYSRGGYYSSYDVPDDIVFEYARNIGAVCVARSDTWRVTARELGEEASASCAEDIVFQNVPSGTSITFDIEAYQDGQLCAQGSCVVTSERGSNAADCASQIQYYCRY